MQNLKYINIIFFSLILGSCTPLPGLVDINLRNVSGAATTPTYSFTTSASALTSKIAGLERVITLNYTETANTFATSCEITNLVNFTVTHACACDAGGICTVTVQGTAGGLGASSFDYRVGLVPALSNWSTISYSQICPTGYIVVPGDATVGANNSFCVMRTEAKNSVGYPVSTTTGFPWDSIDLTNAKAACESLNTLNTVTSKYDIISNPEWMDIARNVEGVATNWSNGVIASGNEMVRGHSDNSPANALDISDINDPYDQTGNSTADSPSLGWEQRRTHDLSNGNVIWDFAGNVWELVDLSLTPGLQTLTPSKKPYASTDGASATAYRELSSIDTMIGENVGDVFLPSFWQPAHATFNHDQGMGQYYAGANTSGGSVLRGGGYYNGNRSGIYAFTLDGETTDNGTYAGFRCVYRP